MNTTSHFVLFFLVSISTVTFSQEAITVSDSLRLIPITSQVFMHVSDQTTPLFGKFTSNGVLFVRNNEALILDTPPTEGLSAQLLAWIRLTYPSVKIKGVVVNHFHSDCLGGLKTFHNAGIASYSHRLTPELLKIKNDPFDHPKNLFRKKLTLVVGGSRIVCQYFGEAHTRDNIVTWIADENVLFGGCMVKAINAGKGNLADANIKDWPATVGRVKKQFPHAKFVVPGHGAFGDSKLLDFTITLFK